MLKNVMRCNSRKCNDISELIYNTGNVLFLNNVAENMLLCYYFLLDGYITSLTLSFLFE